jgi:hypothetical protein
VKVIKKAKKIHRGKKRGRWRETHSGKQIEGKAHWRIADMENARRDRGRDIEEETQSGEDTEDV